MTGPLIVMCAPNGARKTKADHPQLPLSDLELADCAESILAAGAAMMHVHVRDESGRHSLDVDRYRIACNAIRDRVGDALVIQVTSESCGIFRAHEQMQMVRELCPDAVSLGLQEICPGVEAEQVAAEFLAELSPRDIMPQYILYSPADVRRFEQLRTSGVIPAGHNFVLFVLGRYSDDLTGNPGELDAFIAEAGNDVRWAVCCFGRTEQVAMSAAMQAGGHTRVGFENNLLLPDGGLARDNAELVGLAVAAAHKCNRPVATADQVREYFS